MSRFMRASVVLLALCVVPRAQAQSVVLDHDLGLPEGAGGWRIYGYGDFNRDGKTDLVWKRWDDTGEARVWLMDGPDLVSDIGLVKGANGWRVIGVGDFDGDGNVDLAWRRANETGEVRVWLMNGTALLADYGLAPSPEGCRVAGFGDFDGDGKTDLVWHAMDNTGQARIWLLNSGTLVREITLPQMPVAEGVSWKINGVADFNKDGKADLLWRRANDRGEPRIWLLDGAGGLRQEIGVSWDPARDDQIHYDPPWFRLIEAHKWQIVGIGDFNRDGMPDLVWQVSQHWNEANLTVMSILGAGGTVIQEPTLPVGAPGWHVIGTGDFNGDGVTDLAWRRVNESGEVREWLLNWR